MKIRLALLELLLADSDMAKLKNAFVTFRYEH
jgi:hypothetical protein